MAKKTWISVKVGIIDPKHQEEIGPGIWLFLYLCDNANWEKGKVHGYTDAQAAEDLGIKKRTIRDQRIKLQDAGYISCRQRKHDQVVTIHNWTDPRKYSGETINPLDVGVSSDRRSGKGDTKGDIEDDIKDDIEDDAEGDMMDDGGMSVSSLIESSKIKDQPSEVNEEKTSSAPSEREPAMTQDEHDLWMAGITPERWSEQIDVSSYPPDTQDVLLKFCQVFGLDPPVKVTKKDPTVGYWIRGLRRLKEVCGEYGPDLIELTYLDQKLDGKFNIGNPNSAVEFVASKGGELRRHDILPVRLAGMLEQVRKGQAEIDDFWDQSSEEVEA